MRYSAPQQHRAKAREFTGQAPEINHPPLQIDHSAAEKRRSHNASLRSMVRTYIKNVVKAIDAKDAEKAQAAYVLAVPVIDRMADKGIIHKNKAARDKSRLSAKANSTGSIRCPPFVTVYVHQAGAAPQAHGITAPGLWSVTGLGANPPHPSNGQSRTGTG
eukprot:gene44640-55551_t